MAESSARLDGNNKRREKLAKLGIEMKKRAQSREERKTGFLAQTKENHKCRTGIKKKNTWQWTSLN